MLQLAGNALALNCNDSDAGDAPIVTLQLPIARDASVSPSGEVSGDASSFGDASGDISFFGDASSFATILATLHPLATLPTTLQFATLPATL